MRVAIQILPEIYFQKDISHLLFYNTITGIFFLYEIDESDYKVYENIIIFYISSENIEILLKELSDLNWIFILPSIPEKIFARNNYTYLHAEYDKLLNTDFFSKRDNLKDYLFNLTICIDSMDVKVEKDQFLNKQNAIFYSVEDSIIDLKRIKDIFNKYEFCYLQKITFLGDTIFVMPEFKELVSFLKQNYNIWIVISYSDFINYKKEREYKDFDGINYNIICDDLFRQKCKAKNVIFEDNLEYSFYIKNSKDIEFLEKYINHFTGINITPIPLYDNNKEFLKPLLSFGIKDMLSLKRNEIQIIRRSLINDLFWGKLIICNDGNVYSNIYAKSLGNIYKDDFLKILYNASKDKLSWLFSRNKYHKCCQCCCNNLCPPVTSYEIISDDVYCCWNDNLDL